MSPQAKVTSLEAIEAFRSKLIVYVVQARAALEEVGSDITRTRAWIETEQRTNWERELRRRGRALEEAQQALFSARISNLRQESSFEQFAVHKAKRAYGEAEEKLRVIKRWSRDFDNQTQPLLKQIEKLHTILSHDMTLAVASLTETVSTLSDYADIRLPDAAPEAGVPGRTADPGEAAASGSQKGEP